MATQLRLVVDRTAQFRSLIDSFSDLLGSEADGNMALSWSRYDRWPCVHLENIDNGLSMRIIFDPDRERAHRQGQHTTLAIDGYELAQMLDEAHDNGFDTIWVHQ